MASSIPAVQDLVAEGIKVFKETFKTAPSVATCAPGRVNLIGEHTDYNDGFVLPMALPMVTVVVGRKNGTDICHVKTIKQEADAPTSVEFPIPTKQPLKTGVPKWANYVKGVVANFAGEIPGFDAVIISSVPFGGGLSSSAALEVSFYTFLEALTNNRTAKDVTKALACQKAEHDFANMPCGIMDQFISVMGKAGNALLLDCRSMESSHIPISDSRLVIVVTNSNIRHELSASEYPIRRTQCAKAAEILGKKSLRDANMGSLKDLEQKKVDDVTFRRAKHVITEIQRTVQAAAALKGNDFVKFGKLMVESHNSLRTDYEVSCPELDSLVEAATEVPGVLGSRMTGGGFGGCTVTLVSKPAVDELIANIKKKYSGNATFYVVTPSDGCRVLKI